MIDHAKTPLYKVGLLLWREGAASVREVFILQPKPKNAGEVPPFVLPRGSRQYWVMGVDGQKTYHDIRDAETARAHAATLEPLTRTLLREAEEEAGIDAATLRRIGVRELGTREFTSRSKGTYSIHWFVAKADAAACAAMQPLPDDALSVAWARAEQIQHMAEAGQFSQGYLPVIAHALAAFEGFTEAEL